MFQHYTITTKITEINQIQSELAYHEQNFILQINK